MFLGHDTVAPWTSGGHEPIGETAGDHKYGVTVFAYPPAVKMDAWAYGLEDLDYDKLTDPVIGTNGWAWVGANGTFNVVAGATAAIPAPGLTLGKFGTVDLQLSIDTSKLDPITTWNTTVVGIKSSAWGWGVYKMTITGGKGSVNLSDLVGAGHPFNHSGLLNPGDKPEFIFTFGADAGHLLEYKDANKAGDTMGVSAAYKLQGGSFTPVTVQVRTMDPNKGNTYVAIPSP